MAPISFVGKKAVTIVLKDVQVSSSRICFTGDALASLNNYKVTGTVVNMDEWEWHEEVRGGTNLYIITNLTKSPL
ncbi:MAG: hypothetical protein QM640_05950 [Niabella sp.]